MSQISEVGSDQRGGRRRQQSRASQHQRRDGKAVASVVRREAAPRLRPGGWRRSSACLAARQPVAGMEHGWLAVGWDKISEVVWSFFNSNTS